MQAIYKNFKVKSTFKGDKKASWSGARFENWNNHMIKVTNLDTKQSCTFEFWASISNPEIKTEYDLLNAFYCFVSDAVSAEESFENFCGDFGYEAYNERYTGYNKESMKIYKACVKSNEKLQKIYDGDIYDLVNELSENYA